MICGGEERYGPNNNDSGKMNIFLSQQRNNNCFILHSKKPRKEVSVALPKLKHWAVYHVCQKKGLFFSLSLLRKNDVPHGWKFEERLK